MATLRSPCEGLSNHDNYHFAAWTRSSADQSTPANPPTSPCPNLVVRKMSPYSKTREQLRTGLKEALAEPKPVKNGKLALQSTRPIKEGHATP